MSEPSLTRYNRFIDGIPFLNAMMCSSCRDKLYQQKDSELSRTFSKESSAAVKISAKILRVRKESLALTAHLRWPRGSSFPSHKGHSSFDLQPFPISVDLSRFFGFFESIERKSPTVSRAWSAA